MSLYTKDEFDCDIFPLRPRILFIGWPESSHTHSWINLLDQEAFNIRLFCLQSQEPPKDWPIKSYVTAPGINQQKSSIRKHVFPPPLGSFSYRTYLFRQAEARGIIPGFGRIGRVFTQLIDKIERAANRRHPTSMESALVQVIDAWQPHVIHTLGIDPASYFFKRTRDTFMSGQCKARWVVQARGGPDLAIKRFDPVHAPLIQGVIQSCDHFIADNMQNYAIAEEMGLGPENWQNPGLGVVPGPGGLDLDELAKLSTGKPSERERVILWPKAYEINSSKAMPVFEAIIKYWEQLRPCRIEMLWYVQPEIQMWYEKLFPPEIKKYCPTFGRLSHQETLERIGKSRVLLAPSLSDGIPNTMMEAMALGAVPIVSPLDTIVPVVKNEENVLFANNLYPDEIGKALVRLMNDDNLVDAMADNNKIRVQEMADRRKIKARVIAYYNQVTQLAKI
ncbi:MAG: glycosyltransferase [Desulfobacula sp.]|nr:glycosyltransferase [Desulfobacula sp.]